MFQPKAEIFAKLSELDAKVLQGSQTVFNEIPAITFLIQNNSVNLTLDNKIAAQNIAVSVDIWANDSVSASELLSAAEAKFREIGYRLTNSLDIPNPDASLFHVNATFEGLR